MWAVADCDDASYGGDEVPCDDDHEIFYLTAAMLNSTSVGDNDDAVVPRCRMDVHLSTDPALVDLCEHIADVCVRRVF